MSMRAIVGEVVSDLRSAGVHVKRDVAGASRHLRRHGGAIKVGAAAAAEKLGQFATLEYRSRAKDYYENAVGLLAQTKTDRAGSAIKLAADFLEKSFTETGRELDALTGEAIGRARAVAEKIERGADWTRDELSESITKLGRRIEELGSTLGPLDKNKSS